MTEIMGWLRRNIIQAPIWTDPALKTAFVMFLVLRVVLSVWMWGVRQAFPQDLPPDPKFRPYYGVSIEQNPWLEPWQRWDTLHYQAIAERGYLAFDRALFAPPLYPFLIRLVANITQGTTLLAGLIASSGSYIAALFVFYRLAHYEFKDDASAQRAVLMLAIFPTAFFFLAAYAEAFFILTAAGTLYAVRRGRWIWAGFAGGLAALSRLTGVLMIIPLVISAIEFWRKERLWEPWKGMGIFTILASLFPIYTWFALDRSPMDIIATQNTRGGWGDITFPFLNVAKGVVNIFNGQLYVADVSDILFILIFSTAMIPLWRKFPRLYSYYCWPLLLLYLTRDAGIQPLFGTSRYVLTLFPIFLVFAVWGEKPWVNRLILYTSWAGLLFFSGLFALWNWVG
jgi:hypothetical protein